MDSLENETMEQQTNDQENVFERFVDSSNQKQVMQKNLDAKIREAVDNTVTIVEIACTTRFLQRWIKW